jgi:signal transduction histidine kinase
VPAEAVPNLFTPCNSSKKGGSGIGLAISRQLARHLGAELELASTGAEGSMFRLTLKATVPKESPPELIAVPRNGNFFN